ncbi:MAG: helix-turn-helix domain-containing protein [Aminobacterium sp.]|jgi:excisionase family DNA binding protein|nr:helix-turn-helix domain-containing protein [Aminobacterium colombiense]MDD3707526.1 helix-turn-helix domain-containing protein [Aminobacterium sp.]MDD4229355.1 helix-turn-helix domain-containing protein [Aminobacterium sp.]
MEGKRLLTSKEAARYLGISYSYLRTICMTGQIKNRLGPPPHIRVGKARRYVKEDLDKWIDAQPRKF